MSLLTNAELDNLIREGAERLRKHESSTGNEDHRLRLIVGEKVLAALRELRDRRTI